jgi:hypothetical protein
MWQIIETGNTLKGFTLRASPNQFRFLYNEGSGIRFRREQ